MSIISVKELSKKYKLGVFNAKSLREEAEAFFARWRQKKAPDLSGNKERDESEFWALRDISFDVEAGEVVGIIGRNGAGKSTLLKVLSRITEPTSGEAIIRGRVASLLEVGTGFHPELSGRENIFLNGAILGMTKKEIRSKFDEIVNFAEIDRFIDTPVKRYSSGMYVRLAFAVAAHLEPEILIVDEVLAVGDAEFQKKCLGKMKEVSGRGGRTVLFVSHNMAAVRSLCTQAVLLSSGKMVQNGPTEKVLASYEKQGFAKSLVQTWSPGVGSEFVKRHELFLKETRVLYDQHLYDQITVETPLELHFCLHSLVAQEISLSPHYLGQSGEVVFAAPSPIFHLQKGDNWLVCFIPGNFLNDGVYSVQLMIVKNSAAIQVVDEALAFEVHDLPRTSGWFGKWPGVIRPQFRWSSTHLPPLALN